MLFRMERLSPVPPPLERFRGLDLADRGLCQESCNMCNNFVLLPCTLNTLTYEYAHRAHSTKTSLRQILPDPGCKVFGLALISIC